MSTALPIGLPAPPAPAAGPGTLAVPARALTAHVGQVLAARVVSVREGLAELALGGGRLMAATGLPLTAGQTLRMVVAEHVEGRVVLRPQAPATAPGSAAAGAAAQAGTTGTGAALAAALRGAGLSAGTTSAMLATLTATGTTPAPANFGTLVAGATAAGVATPAQAAAYVRLLAAGLPATPQAVAGLALLAEGAPLGRTLAAVVDAARAAAPPPAPAAAPAPGAAPALPAPGGQAPSPAAPGATAGPAGAAPGPQGAPASPAPALPAPPPAAPSSALAVLPAATEGPAGVRAAADALARAVARVADGAVAGDPAALRAAVHELGVAPGPAGAAPAEADQAPATVRALLSALAEHPATEPGLARAAAAAGETIGAQALAAPSTPAPNQSATGGAYLQIPLPGGGTAEVRVAPDGGDGGADGDGERRDGPRTVAMLLHMSALGPVMVTANAGADAVDARIRVEDEAARAFLSRHAAELASALGTGDAAGPARVRVEAPERPAHGRLLAPTPHDGVDRRA
jgi:hypothetical protein